MLSIVPSHASRDGTAPGCRSSAHVADQDISEMYRQLGSVDIESEEHDRILSAIAIATAARYREEVQARGAALDALGYDEDEIYEHVSQATGWFDHDAVQLCADPCDYQQAYTDAVWAAVEARLGEAGIDLSVPAVWESAWDACQDALESPGDPRECGPWVGTLRNEARRRDASVRRTDPVVNLAVTARRIRPTRARGSRGRAVRHRGSRRGGSSSAGGGGSGDPPGDSDSDEPAPGWSPVGGTLR